MVCLPERASNYLVEVPPYNSTDTESKASSIKQLLDSIPKLPPRLNAFFKVVDDEHRYTSATADAPRKRR